LKRLGDCRTISSLCESAGVGGGGSTSSMGCLQYYSPCVFCIFRIKASAEMKALYNIM